MLRRSGSAKALTPLWRTPAQSEQHLAIRWNPFFRKVTPLQLTSGEGGAETAADEERSRTEEKMEARLERAKLQAILVEEGVPRPKFQNEVVERSSSSSVLPS